MRTKLKGPFILGFNGPPRSGKDTVAAEVVKQLEDSGCNLPIHTHSLVETLRDGCAAILGFNGGQKWYEEAKDKPIGLDGMDLTLRQFMIDASEKFLKQTYGKDFWARLLHQRCDHWWARFPSILVITNIGFPDEVSYFTNDRCEHFLNIRLDRPGYDFVNDSRGWVAAQSYGGTDLAVTNDSTPAEAAEHILKAMYRNGWPVF